MTTGNQATFILSLQVTDGLLHVQEHVLVNRLVSGGRGNRGQGLGRAVEAHQVGSGLLPLWGGGVVNLQGGDFE